MVVDMDEAEVLKAVLGEVHVALIPESPDEDPDQLRQVPPSACPEYGP